jgi:cytochrome P450
VYARCGKRGRREADACATAPADSPLPAELPAEPLLTAEFDTDPGAVYARLRRRWGPVAPVSLMGVPVWLVLDYHEVVEVLRDESVWRRDVRHWRARALGQLPPDWPLLAGYEVRQTMFLDGEEHLAARRTLHTALRPFQDARSPRGRELRASITRFADELIAELAAASGTAGFCDLAAQYVRPLLLMVTTRLYGCPVDLGDELVMDLWRMLDGGPDADSATGRCPAAFTRLAAHRRAPGDDLTSYLLRADPDLGDERLGRELFMNAVYLNDITGTMVLNTALEAIRGNATVWSSLSAGQLGETVDRAALVNPPVATMCFRFAARDVRLGDFWIRAGDIASPSAAAAHRDLLELQASRLADPAVSTRAHLGWGAGPHQCPSAARDLGTTIVTIAVGRLLEHVARAELTLPDDQLPWRTGPVVRGLRLLPVRYELRNPQPARSPAAPGGGDGDDGPARPVADRPARGLPAALRWLMPGGRA